MPKALAEHIVSPVRFTDELAAMQAAGIDTFVEFGPKSVLTGLVKENPQGRDCKERGKCGTHWKEHWHNGTVYTDRTPAGTLHVPVYS